VLFRQIVYVLLDPVGFCLLLLLIGLLARKKQKVLFTYFAIAALAVFLLSSTPYLPNFLVSSLERQHLPFGGSNPSSSAYVKPSLDSISANPTTHILILGGGHVADPRLPVNDQISDQALKRLIEGIRIYKMIPNSKLVLSGFSREGIEKTHAEVLAETAIMLGISPRDTLLVKTPWNTMYEAIDYHQQFGNQHPLILVTNAIHMPRALMHFKRKGLSPIPAPTGYLVKRDNLYRWYHLKPGIGSIVKLKKAIHEYVGLFWGKVEWRLNNKKPLTTINSNE
jgi:uncharacterized SAM-binding protein YcdF (DUF218 family)